jgi:hypothetical protein
MRFTMVVPSYWRRPAAEPWRATDSVYDHPVPLDEEGTLGRLLDSLSILGRKDFRLVVLGVANAVDIREALTEKLKALIRSHTPAVQTHLFSYPELAAVHHHLISQGMEDFVPLLRLDGYSNIRNLCVFTAHLFGSEAAVLIDDDEVFEDPEFMDKATEFIGGVHGGREILSVAGYYINPDGDFILNRPPSPWMAHWNKDDCMNRAFAKIIGREPRLKVTPFAFGGNMVIHRKLFTEVPFDPLIPRGEDIDFLINARMFGHSFILDNRLSIKHLPPPKTYPTWRRVREDILRFVFEKKKLDSQEALPGTTRVSAEDLDPYPGEFLKDDLEEKIVRSNEMLAEEYRSRRDPEGAEECLNNIRIARAELRADQDIFLALVGLQSRWKKLMDHFSDPETAAGVREALGLPSRG